MEYLEDGSQIDSICNKNLYFDTVIGHIEDIVLSREFEDLRNSFLEAHWELFEHTDENKLEYMHVFEMYTTTFENFIITELNKRMDDFDMERFSRELGEDENVNAACDYAEILELLYSLTNFETFKEMMLDYRLSTERKTQNLDFDSILITTPLMRTIKTEKH